MSFKETKKQLRNFLFNIGTSGKYREEKNFGMSDYLIRYVLMNFIIIFGVISLAAFTIPNLMLERYFTSFSCIGMIVICIISFLLARTRMRQFIPALILMISYGLLCVMITWTGESDGANFLFIYIYPLITIMLLRMRSGVLLSMFLLMLISLEMFFPKTSRYIYDIEFSTRMLVTYLLILSVMIVIETTRKTKDRLIENQNRKLEDLKETAEAANHTKSNFLASMSHEIRTPMNAISGMAELLLRRDLNDDAKAEVQDIKHAASNLISIINDILDFSKIEAGKMEIIPAKYMLSSLINDTVNIIHMRLTEKPIRFYTNIDSNIPNSLIGDETRLRQILLNLLSNAVKYTDKGFISLSITVQKLENEKVWLEINVTDSGKGIKFEDQSKLFNSFVQFDTKKNKGIEGTGLGLAITKKLCEAMGGDISVESVYGKGSTFTVHITQDISSTEPFAMVENAAEKKVLVYERRTVYAKSVCWSLRNMHIPHTLVTTLEEFTHALLREEWNYVFSGLGLYETIKTVMDRFTIDFPSIKKPSLALMVEWGIEMSIPNVRFMSLPIQTQSIANVLNGKANTKGFVDSFDNIRFTIPKARLLVVDDIAINLKVAEGLLTPYHATVDTCLSGAEAVETVKRRNYDMIFMDHIMPVMDGFEATKAIRNWEKEQRVQGVTRSAVPIIALTANAVVGMREMFIEKGFNDFLAKPIDVSKLDEILDRWIPNEKKGNREWGIGNGDRNLNNELHSPLPPEKYTRTGERVDEQMLYGVGQIKTAVTGKPEGPPTPHSLQIPGIDVKRGIAQVGGKEETYRRLLSLFCTDIEQRISIFRNSTEDITEIAHQAHALKGVTANLGMTEFTVEAAQLEAACKDGDTDYMKENLDCFINHLSELGSNISVALEQ
jgi:signal transduction histidine kinase/CheY-like chemotaxis protein/HPt (histidine-containing phosphotransfer) domain-containing protein